MTQSDDASALGPHATPSLEALVVTAPVARGFALKHCPHALGGDCTWYHGVWQYLRALGVLKRTPGGDGAFFAETLSKLAATSRRVLVSGSADDAMALLAIEAFRDARMPLDLTVIDRCEAPLAMSRWSGKRMGHNLATDRVDVLEYASESPYDVITTSSFLSYFDEDGRSRLFARWASLLRPGGKLLLTNRLRSTALSGSIGFGAEQADVFCATARREAEKHRDILDIDPTVLEAWVREYTARLVTFPLRSVSDLSALLRAAGFVADRIETTVFPGTARSTALSGPTSAGRAEYVRLLATRE